MLIYAVNDDAMSDIEVVPMFLVSSEGELENTIIDKQSGTLLIRWNFLESHAVVTPFSVIDQETWFVCISISIVISADWRQFLIQSYTHIIYNINLY